MEMSKKILVRGTVIATISLMILLLYLPLIAKLGREGTQCRKAEAEVTRARNATESVNVPGFQKDLAGRDGFSLAMDELTRLGKLKKINFKAMNSKTIEKSEFLGLSLAPIEIEFESEYEALGEFFGGLDDLVKSILVVKNFNISSVAEGKDVLKAKLSLAMYLLQ